ncbi:MAG: FGGY family carbohydrate kinase, partial [Candidatus Hydrogenedentes bacterium]|nr:FGGY family carbohydrate kinase [Candidatus Hydrogenedentota bacterium]
LRARCGSRWRRACGIGLAAQGGSSILAERATGRACAPMLLWNDARGADDCAELARRTTPQFWRSQFRLSAPPSGLGRLAWLTRACPDLFTPRHIHAGAGEWVFHRLTKVWRQDAGNALQIGTYSPPKRRLVDTALRLIELPLDIVAPLRQGHETAPLSDEAARLFDLPSGVPVAGPYLDQEAGYLAAADTCTRPLQCSLGTAWVGNFRLPKGVRGSSPFQLVLPSPSDDGDLIVHPLLTGNTSWNWALSTFLDAPPADVLTHAARMMARRVAPPEGLMAIPYTLQPNPIAGTPGAAMFFGVSAATTRDDLLRAVVAGMTCELARVLAALREHGVVDGLVLGGGASQGKFFRDWLAALFHPLPVFYPQ